MKKIKKYDFEDSFSSFSSADSTKCLYKIGVPCFILTIKSISYNRLCLLDSQCDMFEYDDGTTDYCIFFPGVSLKNKNFNELIEFNKLGRNLYILHCETSQENWVENSDLYTNTQDRWEVQNECSTVKRSEHFGDQVSKTKPAGDFLEFFELVLYF